jgi:hypothetical protein
MDGGHRRYDIYAANKKAQAYPGRVGTGFRFLLVFGSSRRSSIDVIPTGPPKAGSIS